MKTFVILFAFLFPTLTIAQFETEEEVTITEEQKDDIYLAGEKVKITKPLWTKVHRFLNLTKVSIT